MLIPFKKVSQTGIDFNIEEKGVKFEGKLFRKSKTLVECEGSIVGPISHYCDRCGKEMTLDVNEEVKLYFHDGIYENEEDSLDIIEFFSGEIDLNEVLESEITSIKSGYFYCSTCKEEN